MTVKEIQELVKLINKSNLSEFKLKDGEFELTIRTKSYGKNKSKGSNQVITSPTVMPIPAPVAPMPPAYPPPAPAPPVAPPPAASSAPAKPAAAESDDTSNLLEIRSPIVGTFYRSSGPDKPPYVSVGDVIEKGAVVCIVEAMKLFNEIESEVSGKIVKKMIEDANPVEYDQVLFLVDPKG